ncbi:MAG: chitobiase/beta-hexosaminidase C-terminal domain-containing protein, partial [Planctomycetes bacterium]|nr:chitobiase/beta-hexosaminidase C-terminal domain-containing protein [Planctomycetota bacterium]
SLDPPLFRINGVPQHGGPVAPGAALTLTNPNGSGTIYYSLDGSDPRLAVPGAPPGAKTLVGEPAAKQVLIPARQIGTAWRNVGYNDPHWIEGAGGVGYERSSGYEPYLGLDVGAQMYGVNASCYLRIPFTVAAADLQNPTGLILKCRYDDGFVAWLNGVEVARDRFLGVPQWNSAAAGSRPDAEAVQLTDFDLTAHIGLLRTGDNLLAIHGLNDSPTSSDFLISAALVTAPATPPAHPNPAHGPTPYTAPIPLAQLTHIKARILDRGQWSALHEATYETAAEN